MNTDVPYNASTLEKGAFQVWHYQPRVFIAKNRIGLGVGLQPDFVTVPLDFDEGEYPISLFGFADGTARIYGRITYNGIPTITTTTSLIDFNAVPGLADRFQLYVTRSNFVCGVRFSTVTPPFGIDCTSWAFSIRGAPGDALFDLAMIGNTALSSVLNTGARLLITLDLVPQPTVGLDTIAQ